MKMVNYEKSLSWFKKVFIVSNQVGHTAKKFVNISSLILTKIKGHTF